MATTMSYAGVHSGRITASFVVAGVHSGRLAAVRALDRRRLRDIDAYRLCIFHVSSDETTQRYYPSL
jgi:hypothetical protein